MTRFDLDALVAGWRGPALAALVALLAGLPTLALLPPVDRDETRTAQATAQMLESGDLAAPSYQGRVDPVRPPGANWLQGAAVTLTVGAESRAIQAFRLPSLAAVMLGAAVLAWLGRTLFGARAGTLGGAVFGAAALPSLAGGLGTADAAGAAALIVAMAGMGRLYMAARAGERPERRHKLIFWSGLAAALLIKGVIAFVFVAPALITLAVIDHGARFMRRLGWGWGLLLVILILGPWAIARTIGTDGGVWTDGLWRTVGEAMSGAFAPGLGLVLLPVTVFPAALLLPAATVLGWTRRTEPAVRFLLAWLTPAWLIVELVPGFGLAAVLPLVAPLALLLAEAALRPVGDRARLIGAGLSVAAAAVLSLLLVYALTEFGQSKAQTWAAVAIAFTALAGVIGAFLLLHRAPATGLVAALALGLVGHAASAATIKQLKPLAVAPRVERLLLDNDLHPRDGRPAPVAATGFDEPSLVFLTGGDTELTDPAGAARALAEGRPAVVEARRDAAFRDASADLGVVGRAVGEVRGHDYVRGEDVRLTVYAPPGAATPSGADR